VLSVSTEEVTVMDSAAGSSGSSSGGGGGSPAYSLPVASASTLGGIKVGTNLSINASGVLSATDTTYESKAAASGGTAVSLVTTGEKYTWNAKQNAISDLSTIRSNASNGNTAYGWGNHASAGYQPASTAITTSNIGQQSVNYATSAGNASKLDNTSKSAFVYATDGNTLGTYNAEGNSVDNLARTMFFRTNQGGGKIGVHIVHSSSVNYAVQIFSNGYANTSGLSYRIKENGTWGTTYNLYHTGNCNNTSTAWNASSLTLNGAISGATNITASGNVGIGTTAPSQKLQVNDGNILVYRSNANNPAGVMLAQYYPSQGTAWTGGVYADYFGNSICTTSGYTHGMFFVGGRANFDNFIFTNKDKTPLAKIDYNGNFVATGNVSAGSDLRWKEHITDFDDNGILKALTPVEWDWKEGHGKGHASGFIAQDIQKIMPYAVGGSEGGGYVLNYNCFHALWAKSLQNHETEIDRLRKRVTELESKLKQLTS